MKNAMRAALEADARTSMYTTRRAGMTSRQIDEHDLDRLMRQWMDDDAVMAEPANLIDGVSS